MLQIHAFVSGCVQGVNFRYYTARQAKAIGLHGFVKNLMDGKVEVVAQGSREQLERMVEWLNHGPASASVGDVQVEWSETKKKLKGFS
ncbi:MAG: acylphosphatase, partial [Candidatus Diapherotrites archaeon]|nr:acylphosphatase [Candidatus Diapherotrites archaeon]